MRITDTTRRHRGGLFVAGVLLAIVLLVSVFMRSTDQRAVSMTSAALVGLVVDSTEKVEVRAVEPIDSSNVAIAPEPVTPEPLVQARHLATGEASYYGPGFAGRPTANGEKFNPQAMTAAHRTLAFGTRLRVTNTVNGRSVEVRVNDRGPYAHGRILDLSQGAAERIGMLSSGTARVSIEVLS